MRLTAKNWLFINLLLLSLTMIVIFMATSVGEQFIWPLGSFTAEQRDIVWVSRFPRVLLAGLAGMALGVSGTSFQGLLQNPLADPYILGVSSGAALGSILGLVLHLPFSIIPFLSFLSAVLTIFVVYGIASKQKQVSPHTLLLTGVILNAFLFALILLLNSFLNFEQSQKVLLLLIGSLEAESYQKIMISSFFVLSGTLFLITRGYILNLISSGSELSSSLGLDVVRSRRQIFFAASLVVGAVVPLVGLVGFIGLFVPHITRLLFGADHRWVLPASGWVGAIILIICDTVARTALISSSYQTELPVGAVTAFLGAPFFLILLKKRMT